jgi:glycosyltransferase involved in cell wall biosynthesis
VTRTSSMKVLQLNSMNIWRGGEVHVLLLCRQLISLGVNVTLTCRSGSIVDQKAREAKIPVINLPLKGTIDLKSSWTLANYCRKNSIDIIHAHNGRDYWMANWAKFFNPKLKVVITRHILAPFKNTPLHRWIYKKVDQVITVSQAVKKAITIFPPEKITVVYNGIDIEKFATAAPGTLCQELGISAQTKIVGMVGRVNPSKGHLTFFQSIPEILAKCPDTVFVIAGSGDISQLPNLGEHVHFLGERKDIPAIMKDLDVLVMASRNEPFGLVTVEAMASGTPVVGANSGGTAEIISDGETGLLFPPEDPAKLAEAVIKVLTDAKLADKLKEGGRNAAKKYNINDMVSNIRNIYQEVLRETKTGDIK